MKPMRIAILLLLLAACRDQKKTVDPSAPPTADSAVLLYQDQAATPTDTDDHNKPSTEGIALDSPIGPQPGIDSVLHNPAARKKR